MVDSENLFQAILSTIPKSEHDHIKNCMKSSSIQDCFFREVYYLWTEEQKIEAAEEIITGKNGVYRQILCDHLSLQQTINKYNSHKKFIIKTYKRFRKGFPNLSLSTVEEHDLSKMCFLELVGYTARFEWGLDCPVWREALLHHYQHNKHHPQYYPPGQNMEQCHLEESVVDMLACRWERRLHGSEDASVEEITYCEEVFLDRYTPEDKEKVEIILKNIVNLYRT